jgi:hypothetical protein
VKSKRFTLITGLTILCLAASCTPRQPEKPAQDQAAPKPIRGQEYGRLEMMNITTTPAIDSLTLRGLFRNPYDEPIEDIRIVLRITSDSSPTSRILVRAQNLMETVLEPGASVPFAITAKVNPESLTDVGMFLDGFAVRRGGEVLPVSPVWEE